MPLFEAWTPELPESSDEAPLATSIRDLLFTFPYHRLPKGKLAWFVRPECVLLLLLLYLVSPLPLRAIQKKFHTQDSKLFHAFVSLHNLALAVFSLVTAVNAWQVAYEFYTDFGFLAVYCDTNGMYWKNGLGAWSTIFYLSKYYEFVDTWILVLKGKEASFLQVYHHTGIALIMYWGVASQSAWLQFVVLLNSVIHTLMYTYFFIKTISPTTQIKAARHLTTAQIVQFFTGIAASSGVLVMGSDCDTQSSRFLLSQAYICMGTA